VSQRREHQTRDQQEPKAAQGGSPGLLGARFARQAVRSFDLTERKIVEEGPRGQHCAWHTTTSFSLISTKSPFWLPRSVTWKKIRLAFRGFFVSDESTRGQSTSRGSSAGGGHAKWIERRFGELLWNEHPLRFNVNFGRNIYLVDNDHLIV